MNDGTKVAFFLFSSTAKGKTKSHLLVGACRVFLPSPLHSLFCNQNVRAVLKTGINPIVH